MVTFREVLLGLMDLPGATYSCVADRVSGTLLGEVGASSVAPGVVMEWGGAAAGFLATTSGDGLDDLMITSHRSYHLVRPVAGDTRQLLMIYLCLDRGRSNLAVARRELAAPRLHKRLATASVGPPVRAPDGSADSVGPRVRSAVPAALMPRQGSSPAVALLARPAARESVPDLPADPPVDSSTGGGEPRLAPSVVPLPRRSGPSRVPPPAPPEPAVAARQSVAGQTWATDVGTMRRLLAALRSLR